MDDEGATQGEVELGRYPRSPLDLTGKIPRFSKPPANLTVGAYVFECLSVRHGLYMLLDTVYYLCCKERTLYPIPTAFRKYLCSYVDTDKKEYIAQFAQTPPGNLYLDVNNFMQRPNYYAKRWRQGFYTKIRTEQRQTSSRILQRYRQAAFAQAQSTNQHDNQAAEEASAGAVDDGMSQPDVQQSSVDESASDAGDDTEVAVESTSGESTSSQESYKHWSHSRQNETENPNNCGENLCSVDSLMDCYRQESAKKSFRKLQDVVLSDEEEYNENVVQVGGYLIDQSEHWPVEERPQLSPVRNRLHRMRRPITNNTEETNGSQGSPPETSPLLGWSSQEVNSARMTNETISGINDGSELRRQRLPHYSQSQSDGVAGQDVFQTRTRNGQDQRNGLAESAGLESNSAALQQLSNSSVQNPICEQNRNTPYLCWIPSESDPGLMYHVQQTMPPNNTNQNVQVNEGLMAFPPNYFAPHDTSSLTQQSVRSTYWAPASQQSSATNYIPTPRPCNRDQLRYQQDSQIANGQSDRLNLRTNLSEVVEDNQGPENRNRQSQTNRRSGNETTSAASRQPSSVRYPSNINERLNSGANCLSRSRAAVNGNLRDNAAHSASARSSHPGSEGARSVAGSARNCSRSTVGQSNAAHSASARSSHPGSEGARSVAGSARNCSRSTGRQSNAAQSASARSSYTGSEGARSVAGSAPNCSRSTGRQSIAAHSASARGSRGSHAGSEGARSVAGSGSARNCNRSTERHNSRMRGANAGNVSRWSPRGLQGRETTQQHIYASSIVDRSAGNRTSSSGRDRSRSPLHSVNDANFSHREPNGSYNCSDNANRNVPVTDDDEQDQIERESDQANEHCQQNQRTRRHRPVIRRMQTNYDISLFADPGTLGQNLDLGHTNKGNLPLDMKDVPEGIDECLKEFLCWLIKDYMLTKARANVQLKMLQFCHLRLVDLEAARGSQYRGQMRAIGGNIQEQRIRSQTMEERLRVQVLHPFCNETIELQQFSLKPDHRNAKDFVMYMLEKILGHSRYLSLITSARSSRNGREPLKLDLKDGLMRYAMSWWMFGTDEDYDRRWWLTDRSVEARLNIIFQEHMANVDIEPVAFLDPVMQAAEDRIRPHLFLSKRNVRLVPAHLMQEANRNQCQRSRTLQRLQRSDLNDEQREEVEELMELDPPLNEMASINRAAVQNEDNSLEDREDSIRSDSPRPNDNNTQQWHIYG